MQFLIEVHIHTIAIYIHYTDPIKISLSNVIVTLSKFGLPSEVHVYSVRIIVLN